MKRKPLSLAPLTTSSSPEPKSIVIKKAQATDLLERLAKNTELVRQAPATLAAERVSPPVSIMDQWNAAIGCKTSEVALRLLVQLVTLEHPKATDSEDHTHAQLMNASAMLAELEPRNATEAFLAAQMVGTQRQAMQFLANATIEGQTVVGADANILRATRLMRLFNEQVETMMKLKGKGGQQKVVVEHVTVNQGGQAIVGAVAATKIIDPGGGGGQ